MDYIKTALKFWLILVVIIVGMNCATAKVDTGPTWSGPADWAVIDVDDDDPYLLGYRQYVKPVCQWCEIDNGKPLVVHHIIPQRMWRDGYTNAHFTMNDPTNLVTLHATGCHLIAGHKGNYKNAVTNFWKVLEESRR
jgi:hypothetical protein